MDRKHAPGTRDAGVTLVWFRQDLRLADHPALDRARRSGPVVPVYIWSPEEEGSWPPGAASRWWLHHSLQSLGGELRRRGSRLVIRRGPIVDTLRALASETGAARVVFSRRYEPAARTQEDAVRAAFSTAGSAGLVAEACNAALLFEPWEVSTKEGRPYQVFTPFWRACLAAPEPPQPLPAPRALPAPVRWPRSLEVDDLELLPKADWAPGLRRSWQPGEPGAHRRLRGFLSGPVAGYADDRNRPDLEGTSRLSPHLHFGEIGPRQVWLALRRASFDPAPGTAAGADAFAREIGWREFAYHLLWHFPHTAEHPLRAEFARFPWARSPRALRAWQRGRTGYPLVDAGMRELWATGWMHNRVRMIAGSFLVKDLLLSWTEGARWFWDTLVDADLANNTLGWQWTAGCGADAAPYFRVFNPVGQGEKFDPAGEYVRRWLPELARLPATWIHRPMDAPAELLHGAGMVPGREYPKPLVDHAAARERALAALATIRRTEGAPAARPAPARKGKRPR